MKPKPVCALAFLTLLVLPRPAMGPQWSDWPLERLIANLEDRAYRAAAGSPSENRALYSLGRAHAFAFVFQRTSLRAADDLRVSDREQQEKFADSYVPLTDAHQRLDHLVRGVQHLRNVCSIAEPDTWWNGQKHLTLAWLLEKGAHLADRVDTLSLFGFQPAGERSPANTDALRGPILDLGSEDSTKAETAWKLLAARETLTTALPLLVPETASSNPARQRAAVALIQRYWIERAIDEYWQAFDLSINKDIASGKFSVERSKGVEGLVSFEALHSYRRLVQERGIRPSEVEHLARAEELWKQFEALPHSSWVTPLLLTLSGCKTLDELITPDLTVPFDLDGDFVTELWPWLAPGTGWLVWDPQHKGEITSGRQLFGSASAWLFFENGYRVLDALDDDRSGELRGPELTGIAVWFDRDTDGVSDRGEVVPVEELGIVALATESTLHVGPSPANLCGLELADGRVLPTYDWVLETRNEL